MEKNYKFSSNIPSGGRNAPSVHFKRYKVKERIFTFLIMLSAILIIAIIAGIVISLILNSTESFKQHGLSSIFSKEWNPVAKVFGILPFILGTLLTSLISLAIAIPFSLSISFLLGEYIKTGFIASFFKSTTELLAGIPSVIYGFWGLFFIVPFVRIIQQKFNVIPTGVGILTSAIVLSIMVIPYAASIGREVIELVPSDIKEAAFSLGATRFEVIKNVVIPYARSGILAGIILAFGRAIGETMAVTMLIGNRNRVPGSILHPANTMASIIANEFPEALDKIHSASLIKIALVLLIISLIINMIGKYVIKRTAVH